MAHVERRHRRPRSKRPQRRLQDFSTSSVSPSFRADPLTSAKPLSFRCPEVRSPSALLSAAAGISSDRNEPEAPGTGAVARSCARRVTASATCAVGGYWAAWAVRSCSRFRASSRCSLVSNSETRRWKVRDRLGCLTRPGKRLRQVEIDLVTAGVFRVVRKNVAKSRNGAHVPLDSEVRKPTRNSARLRRSLASRHFIRTSPMSGLSDSEIEEGLELFQCGRCFRLIALRCAHLLEMCHRELVPRVVGARVRGIERQELAKLVGREHERFGGLLAEGPLPPTPSFGIGPKRAVGVVVDDLAKVIRGRPPTSGRTASSSRGGPRKRSGLPVLEGTTFLLPPHPAANSRSTTNERRRVVVRKSLESSITSYLF